MYTPIEIMTFFGKLKEYNILVKKSVNKKIKKYFNGNIFLNLPENQDLVLEY